MRPTLLCFNLPDAKLSKLRFACMKCGILSKAVDPADFAQPLGALCGLTGRIDAAPAAPFSGEMLVMCHMDDAAVNRLLTVIRQLRVPSVALKAILTPTNAAWTACQLHAELTAERQAVMRGETASHEE